VCGLDSLTVCVVYAEGGPPLKRPRIIEVPSRWQSFVQSVAKHYKQWEQAEKEQAKKEQAKKEQAKKKQAKKKQGKKEQAEKGLDKAGKDEEEEEEEDEEEGDKSFFMAVSGDPFSNFH
jgi:ATPase subunit of ABC transporter with duplicated ATPase domains